jgi:polyisoprenoid-binding protein YceI
METQKFNIKTAQSNIEWIGRKVTGAHNGTIAVKSGVIIFDNGHLTKGNFAIDTRSIEILDITDPDTRGQFAAHLASDDFFNSDQYPEARYEIAHAEPRGNGSYYIEGILTIKGISHAVNFDAQVTQVGERVTATGKITIDRTKFGIKFRSGNFFKDLGDTLIYNHFDLNVSINAEAVKEPALL